MLALDRKNDLELYVMDSLSYENVSRVFLMKGMYGEEHKWQ